MVNAIRQKVIVQPGGRIELHAPELKPGTHAEVIILEDSPQPPGRSLRSLIGTAKGCFSSPEETDAFLSQERDSWD